jgi:tetratricopeptide (TPR) repeat protein
VASLKDVEKLDYNNLGTSELSEKLLVRYIAQGTLWKMGDMFQLSIELYDTKDKKVVWSDRWQEKWENLSMIKGNLSDGLLQALSTKPKVAKKVDFTNTEAYEYYLKGKHKFHVRTNKEDIEIAVGFLQKSIILDEGLIEAKHIIAHAQPTLQENLKLMEAIIEEATKLGNKLALAKAYDSKGWFLWNLSKYELAENSFNNAISLFEELENRRGISGSLNGLGFVYLFLGQSNSALETWTMGIKIAEEIDDKEELHHLCMHLALFYISEEKYKEAKQLLDKSREYSGECNNETSKAIFLHVEGRIDFYKKDYDSASLSFKKSYEIVEKLNDKTNYIWSFSWYILTQIISGEINQENNLKLIHKRIEDGWLLDIDFPEVYHNLYRIYKALNDIDKANFYLDLAYNKVSELAEKIENTEYKESFFHSKWNSKLLADWKTFNKK